jgi:hypothetical protein
MGDVRHDQVGALDDVLYNPAVIGDYCGVIGDVAVCIVCARIDGNAKCCF